MGRSDDTLLWGGFKAVPQTLAAKRWLLEYAEPKKKEHGLRIHLHGALFILPQKRHRILSLKEVEIGGWK